MTSNQPSQSADAGKPLGFAKHDHTQCVSTAVAAAEARCARDGLRLTPVRKKVLELLLQEHRALGAYALLDLLKDAGFGSQPPVAYRALDFLTEHGFAHKIERLNAFVACSHPDEHHSPAFMVCRLCDAVAEAHAIPAKSMINDAAKAVGFKVERTVVEAEGICPDCVDKAPA
ncbi:transcriptional repressor [Tateyamaria sp. ANG-S1]|uniref:transcriptional repressor n=1 Tax=Tateyamaria sp. ANG-S1 TaxID=1577905 RepID=UPI0005807C36|nr:transcriptional repressor [Tateyamaria sp. ANG-S1]KIC52058.1 Fur family transcriptional regulator [Tateyamaria sp. ANG-S1]